MIRLFYLGRTFVALLALLCGALSFVTIDTGLHDDDQEITTYSAIVSPRLEIRYRRDRLHLNGHTSSVSHEASLMQSAGRLFSGSAISTFFKPLGMAPEHWATTSISSLEALSATLSGTAVLADNVLRIRAVATDGWNEALKSLHHALDPSIGLDVDVLIPEAGLSARNLCQRAFDANTTGRIGFEESTTVLRSSAKSELQRVISLADACRNSTLSIIGHSDSSGSESSNLELSRARAEAVAGFVADRGIARERIITIGKGSSEPVADNATRYGRSLNRRIEIRFNEIP